jgi:hypothetical protein
VVSGTLRNARRSSRSSEEVKKILSSVGVPESEPHVEELVDVSRPRYWFPELYTSSFE